MTRLAMLPFEVLRFTDPLHRRPAPTSGSARSHHSPAHGPAHPALEKGCHPRDPCRWPGYTRPWPHTATSWPWGTAAPASFLWIFGAVISVSPLQFWVVLEV